MFIGVIFLLQNLSIVTTEDIQFTAVALIPLGLSVVVGNWIHHRVSQEKFLKIAYVLLLMSGLSAFI